MSKTNKIRRLTRQLQQLETQLSFANSEFCQRINRPVKHVILTPPVLSGYGAQDMQRLLDYVYDKIAVEMNFVFQTEEWEEDISFELYLDNKTFYSLREIDGLQDLYLQDGNYYLYGCKIWTVNANEQHINLVRVK